tara:strand:- start:12506 stop:12712 length:207 start_codon:yes stop_codon:yes gene_type:complete
MSMLQHHLHYTITCQTCGEYSDSQARSEVEDAVKAYEAEGWGFASYKSDSHVYLTCPRCKREIPEIPI